jgi:hypothetical protein
MGLLVLGVPGLAPAQQADPTSDAPEPRLARPAAGPHPPTHADALRSWRTPEQVNAWIAERFEYDAERALRLSESQRQLQGSLPIHDPQAFYDDPKGVCVDLARFGVETLQAIAPELKAQYVMIEFDPVTVRGNTLRRHWLASFEREGRHYFYADSKRPGFIAGPYAGTQAFIDDYARYRARPIVAFRELPSYRRKMRAKAERLQRDGG